MIDTEKIANLSRLVIPKEDHDSVEKKFLDVLKAFDVLASVEIKNVEDFQKPSKREDLREDLRKPSLGQERALNLAPQEHNGHFRVPSVL